MSSNPQLRQERSLIEQFKETRERTLDLVKTLEKDDFVVQTAFFYEPAKMARWARQLDLRSNNGKNR